MWQTNRGKFGLSGSGGDATCGRDRSQPDGSLRSRPHRFAELTRCPRCGLPLQEIVWGRTNCPNCGLHFECC